MITVAIDAATDLLSVAAAGSGSVAERHLVGARHHARRLIPLLDEVLAEVGAAAGDIGRVILADGPGSFTGLRVATAMAKGLTRAGQVTLAVTPSLLGRASRVVAAVPVTVLATSSALRGEVYAGWYRFTEHRGIVTVRQAVPLGYAGVVEGPVPDLIVGDGPDGLLDALGRLWDRPVAGRESAMADARALLALDGWAGGLSEVTVPAAWEPVYGRPAEAQAKWEREHGRSLPDTGGRSL